MKVIHLSHSDTSGGAARAAYRIHQSLLGIGIESSMWVNESNSRDWSVESPSKKGVVINKIRSHLVKPLKTLLKTENPILHSPSILPSSWVSKINNSDADVVHLHWVQHEMLSVEDIGRIKKHIVWTLHDMWAFCGAEHYTEEFRWRDGYQRKNRPEYEDRFDLNRWTWKRKKKQWKQAMHIVTPSHWLADCVQQSALMKNYSVTVVANPINTTQWKPIEKSTARELLGLPSDKALLLFGAIGGNQDPRKGYDLLLQSLEYVSNKLNNDEMELVVFGQNTPEAAESLKFPIHFTGHLNDDISLRVVYSAADAMIVPSRQEAFGQTASEAHACGTPVVAFDIGGLSDIIEHKRTGYLAKPFDTQDLANGIEWVLSQQNLARIGNNARNKAEQCYSQMVIANKYISVYNNISS